MSGAGYRKGARYYKLLRIRSDNRIPGFGANRTSNFAVNLGSNCQNVQSVSIANVTFLNTFPNIYGPNTYTQNTSYNNQWTAIASNFATTTINEKTGYYNTNQLMTQLVSELTALDVKGGGGETFTLVQDPITNLVTFTITSTGAYQLAIDMSTQIDKDGTIGDRVSNPWLSLGFTPNSFANTAPIPTTALLLALTGAGSISYTGAFFPKLFGTQTAFIKSQALAPANAFDEKGTVTPIMLSIPIKAPYNSLNTFECFQDALCEVLYGGSRNLSVIDIQLVDHEENELPLYDTPMDIELRVWFNVY